ncbi:MAG: AHH domain-containing protein, partial [Pelagimonas sp.]|nr:AHH domain-containing protein [Pelagimonas sp.]
MSLEDHHIVPKELFKDPDLAMLFADVGFSQDSKAINLMGLPNEVNAVFTVHHGSHPGYRDWVRTEIEIILAADLTNAQKKGQLIGLTNVLKVAFSDPAFTANLNGAPSDEIFEDIDAQIGDYRDSNNKYALYFNLGAGGNTAIVGGLNNSPKYAQQDANSALDTERYSLTNSTTQSDRLAQLATDSQTLIQNADLTTPEGQKRLADALNARSLDADIADLVRILNNNTNKTLVVKQGDHVFAVFPDQNVADVQAIKNLGAAIDDKGTILIDAVSLSLFVAGLVSPAGPLSGTDLSIRDLVRLVKNSNVLSESFQYLDDVLEQVGQELAITALASLSGFGLVYKAYEIYESLAGLKIAIGFASKYIENDILDGLNNVVEAVEFWFGEFSLTSDNVYENANFANLMNDALTSDQKFKLLIAVKDYLEGYGQSVGFLLGEYDLYPAFQELENFVETYGQSAEPAVQDFIDALRVAVANSDISLQESREMLGLAEAQDCFPAGTLITLTDGTAKPVESITQSDVVLTFDADGNPVPGVVDKLFTNTTQEFITLDFADGREKLTVTPGHRFVTETGDYMEIGHLLRLGAGSARV